MVAHLEARLEPVSDNQMRVEWFHNDHPVHSSRIKTIHDFGFVILELYPVEPQDNGRWICRATNNEGTAETQTIISVCLFRSVFFAYKKTSKLF
jgi:hypothetical protein